MVIKKLSASFGKLGGDSLELSEGLNVICAPNESGKSTWCAFIRAMLYGVDSSERARAGHLPDKQRYAPWSGAPMEGSMDVGFRGRDITLTRTTRLKNAPMREFSAVYAGTNVPVEGMTAQNAGEMLTGASREVFRRSSFIEQGAVAVSGDAELEKRIAAIVSSGDETCSYTEADETLRAWQRKRKFKNTGLLPKLENRMIEKKRLLSELENAVNEKKRLDESLARCRSDCERLENEVAECRKAARKDALSKLHEVRQDCEAAQKKRDDAAEKMRGSEAALGRCVLGTGDPESVSAAALRDKEDALAAKSISERENSIVPAALCLILGAVLALVGVLVSFYAYFAAVVPFALSCFLLSKYRKNAEAIIAAAQKRQSILFKYSAEDESEIDARIKEHAELYEKYLSSSAELENAENGLLEMKRRQAQTESSAMSELDFSGGSSDAVRLSQSLAAARENEKRLSRSSSELKGRIEAIGDPLVIASELKSAEAEYGEMLGEYDAISLAVETLRAADTDIQSRFSPELGKTAAEYMSIITGGRYGGLLINRDFSARTVAEGDSIAREAEYLSAGTLDLMYLCLRLAICKLALPESASAPLILDDTLVNLDDGRTRQAMTLLREIAKERQVILFTCKPL